MSSISIADMQSFAENLDGSDIKISSNIGNVIELHEEDLGDDLGIGLLSNNRSSGRPAVSVAPMPPVMERLDDIGISSLEPLESVSFDIPSGRGDTLPDIFINRENSNPFSNDQSASGPSISLAATTRLSPEEEKKKTQELNLQGFGWQCQSHMRCFG
jgi:hypothetical protein